MDEDKASEPPPPELPPLEGEVLSEQWRLLRLTARGPAGDLFDAEHIDAVGEPARIWVLAPRLGGPAVLELLRDELDAINREAADVRWLEATTDRRGVIYVAVAAVGDFGSLQRRFLSADDARSALRALLVDPPSAENADAWVGFSASADWMPEAGAAAESWDAAAAPAASPAPAAWASAATGVALPLARLQERRLAAASAGLAPLAGRSRETMAAMPIERPEAPAPAPAASAQPAAPAPPPARRSRATLWGGAALGGAAALGVLVLATAQLGEQLSTPFGKAAGPPVGDDTTTASNAISPPSDPAQALAGSWALEGGDCERPTRLTVVDGRLIAQGAAGPITVGEIQGVGPDGGIVVGTAQGGSTIYRVSGDTLTVTSGRHPPLDYTRCANGGAAANATNAAGEAALIAMALAGASGAAPEPPPVRDEVDVSAFAPKRLRAGGAALVQIYLHLVAQEAAAADRARAADPEAALRGQTTLGLELARGTRVDVMLDAGKLAIDEPIQSLIWRGRPATCQFAVSTPAETAEGSHVLTARLLVDGVPLGRLAFTMAVDAGAAAETPELTGDDAARYTRAFLSYSSLDRPEVLKTAQTLRATGIDFFQDILSIEPGEAWRERLFAEIDRCDLFLLFWSSHAASSEWVRQEAEYALARHRASTEGAPDIRPIILEGPPIPPPPGSLAALHFNDMLRYMVVASELEAKARGGAERLRPS